MIRGIVTSDGVPVIQVVIEGHELTAIIDTGFNGDLELPAKLSDSMNARYVMRSMSLLAGGQSIEEDVFAVNFPFDGKTIKALATFVAGTEVLIGTNLLREHRLEIVFKTRVLILSRKRST